MAETICVFLRGINIGSIRIKMEDLRQAFLDMGFTSVQTKLATGNVIATAPDMQQDKDELKDAIERELSRRFGYEAYVLLRDEEDLAQICASAEAMSVPEGCHQYFLFCDDKQTIQDLTGRFEAMQHEKNEQWMPHTQGAFWIVPKGATLTSEFGYHVLGDARYKSVLTSRNMNTVFKVYQRMISLHP